MPVNSLVGKADELGDSVRQLIRAYHGSPYDWDRVDMSMVTKGEGPLDEGFGFYATDREGVADWYRNSTTVIRRKILADQLREMRHGLRASPADQLFYTPARLAQFGGRDSHFHSSASEAGAYDWHRRLQRARKIREEVQPQLASLQREFPRGRTYELEIGVPRDSLMEYDVPVYAQQPEVLEKMRAVNSQLVDDLMESPDADGAMFYNTLAGGNIFDPPTIGGQRRASEILFKAGIPGHAYRGNADNYVFYPGAEDSIRILRKR
jgi:hypothetical protein